MKDYKKLEVWRRSHELVKKLYCVTRRFPRDEQYGLTSQLRRAAVSVPGNIAEGCGRDGDAEFGRFLKIAYGSLAESDYYILLSGELGYMDQRDCNQLLGEIQEIQKMLFALIRRTKKS